MRDFLRAGNAAGEKALTESERQRRTRFIWRWVRQWGLPMWVFSSILRMVGASEHWRRSSVAYLEYGLLVITTGAVLTALGTWCLALVMWKVLDRPSIDHE